MSADLPAVSVIMPVYNSGATLRAAIDSILHQTYANFELLIVDDGSEDDSRDIVAAYTDPRIVLYSRQHEGLGAALNFALSKASNEIIARMDADDLSISTRLEEQIKYFVTLPQNAVLSCWYALFSGRKLLGSVHGPTDHASIYKRLALHNELTHSGIMCRKHFILDAGGYKNIHFEDFELWLRLKDQVQFRIYPAVLSFVRVVSHSFSRQGQETKDRMVYELLNRFSPGPAEVQAEFAVSSFSEADILLGWREFFYGLGSKARNRWGRYLFKRGTPAKLYLAYAVSLLPQQMLVSFRHSYWRFRLLWFVNYFAKQRRVLIKKLNQLDYQRS